MHFLFCILLLVHATFNIKNIKSFHFNAMLVSETSSFVSFLEDVRHPPLNSVAISAVDKKC